MTRAGESPVFDTKKCSRVGDVTDSIEVLQTSCEGLNPFRSTKIIFDLRLPICDWSLNFHIQFFARVAQLEEAKVSKTFQRKFESCREYFNNSKLQIENSFARVAQSAEAFDLKPKC